MPQEKCNLFHTRALEEQLGSSRAYVATQGPSQDPSPPCDQSIKEKNTKKRTLEWGSAFGLWMGEGGSILEGNPESKLTSFERRKENKMWNRRTEPALTSP